MASFRFHVVALPHTQTSKLHCGCAYTMKVLNFCRMMRSLGHTVFHYGAEGSQADCHEHVSVVSQEEQRLLCGTQDWRRETYSIAWDERMPYWQLCNSRALAEILRRKQPRDFVCLIGGSCQKPIADHVGNDVLCVEFGVGYRGVFAKYRVFESYAHQARVYGAQQPDGDGNFYDAVIPNYYDPADFAFCPKKQDYFLYIGRLIRRKGLQIAVETTRAIGARLLIAGQGIDHVEPGKIYTTEGHCYEGAHLQYLGFADVERRADLMGHARAVFVPTLYLEPFGGVNVESQLCGTPVITTDWGAFPETVEHGLSGYRCRTLEQFVWAAQHVAELDPQAIRDRAVRMYSLDRVRQMYQEYFSMLGDLWDKGWYTARARTQLDWLTPLRNTATD